MDLATGMTALIPFHTGTHIPEMLGSFHLDDHNVEEWSDATKPGTRHRGRKEIGKWTNSERNADIKYQKEEDNTKFDGGQEKQQREVIEGKAPDSAFQIIRTQRQIKDTDENNGSRVSTTATSYQISSSNGIRSTSKTTSNKTMSKTVTVSGGGGGRADDFENLKLSYQPLDTSTQRDRIHMSRSGTMGVRRPPTRRHNQPAILSSNSNLENNFGPLNSINNTDEKDEEKSETLTSEAMDEQQQQQIINLGLKKISPKICVGFPAEVQKELQTKLLRGPNSMLANGERINLAKNEENKLPIEYDKNNKRTSSTAISNISLFEEKRKSHQNMDDTSETECHDARLNQNSNNNNISREFKIPIHTDTNSSFDFNQRRKSYGFESFDNSSTKLVRPIIASFEPLTQSNIFINDHSNNDSSNTNTTAASSRDFATSSSSPFKSLSQQLQPPPSLSTSWDIIRNATNLQTTDKHHQFSPAARECSPFPSYSNYLNSETVVVASSKEEKSINGGAYSSFQTKPNPFLEGDDNHNDNNGNEEEVFNNTQSQRISNKLGEFTLDSLEFNNNNSFEDYDDDEYEKKEEGQQFDKGYKKSGPDVVLLHDDDEDEMNDVYNNVASSTKERVLNFKMLPDKTPDILNQMSFRNNFSPPPQKSTAASHSANSVSNNNNDFNIVKRMWAEERVERSRSRSHHDNTSSNNHFHTQEHHFGKPINNKTEEEEIGEANDDDVDNDSEEFFLNDKKEFILNQDFSSSSAKNRENHDDDDFFYENDPHQLNLVEMENEGFDFNYNNFMQNSSNLKQTQISQTWITSTDSNENLQHYARDNDVTTSIYAINDPCRKPLKKVEFCKTEVHFTPEPGKFHIVESDENKPSTIHLYRRRKRGERKSLEFLKNSLLEINAQFDESNKTTNKNKKAERVNNDKDLLVVESGNNNNNNNNSNGNAISTRKGETMFTNNKLWTNEQDKEGYKLNNTNNIMTSAPTFVPLRTPTVLNSASKPSSSNKFVLRSNDLSKTFHDRSDDEILTEERILAAISSDPKNSRLSFSPTQMQYTTSSDSYQTSRANNNNLSELNDNLYNDDEEENDSNESTVQTIFTNYGDLKIQRYLKQLKPSSSYSQQNITKGVSDTNKMTITGEEDRSAQDEAHFRYDNLLYEHGSFVPLATRRSLIEMNNRNRKQQQLTPKIGTLSDNSSTISNYSLPSCSDNSNSNKSEFQQLKLTAMEATVATTGRTPKITSVDLRYSIDDDELEHNRKQKLKSRIQDSKMGKTSVSSNDVTDKSVTTDIIGRKLRRSLDRIPSPVMPSGLTSLQPLHKHRETHSAFSLSPTSSPAQQSPNHISQKPPTPIPPIQYSTEKKGAELRDRFYSKNHLCVCKDKVSNFEDEYENNNNNNNNLLISSNNIISNRLRGTSPSKSIVNIGGEDEDRIIQSAQSEIKLKENHRSSRISSEQQGIEMVPILSLDPSWKGSAADIQMENQSKNGTSILRSLTFPKTTRPEPEWVSKAKSRENRITDWSIIDKQYGSYTNPEPPWISELRVKNKTTAIVEEEPKNNPKVSVVYPWQKETSPSRVLTEEEPNINNQLLTNDFKPSPQHNGRLSPMKSTSAKSVSNKTSEVHKESSTVVTAEIKPEIINNSVESKSKRIAKSETKEKRISSQSQTSRNTSREKVLKTPDSRPSSTDNESLKSKNESPKPRKSLQSKTSLNSSSKNLNGNINNENQQQQQVKLKTPPKPPQRGTNITTQTTKVKKSFSKGRVISDVEDSTPISTRSNTPIHHHPMVKVAKLPLKSQKSSPSSERKSTTSSNKTKTHVSLLSEAKRVCQGKLDVHLLNNRNKNGSAGSSEAKQQPSADSSRIVTPSPKSVRRDTESSNAKKKR